MSAKELVTLIAAVIGATASVIVLLLNLNAQRKAELRLAHRKSLEPHVADLGESLHQILACSNILLKTKSEVSRKNWLERAKQAQKTLKALRLKLRYPLWGLDDGFRVLSRLPDWCDHLRGDVERGRRLLKRADRLRAALDGAILGSYTNGRPPRRTERWLVAWHARQCATIFPDPPQKGDEAEPGDEAPAAADRPRA